MAGAVGGRKDECWCLGNRRLGKGERDGEADGRKEGEMGGWMEGQKGGWVGRWREG